MESDATAHNKMFMPARGSVLLSSSVFLISFGNVGRQRASKTQAVTNINVGRKARRRHAIKALGQIEIWKLVVGVAKNSVQ